MADYKISSTGMVVRNADGAIIPTDPSNTDYIAYQAWLAKGNTPDPAPVETPPPSPLSVLAQVLVSKGLVSQADLNTAAADAGVTFNQTSTTP